MHSEERAISLSLKVLPYQPRPARNQFQVGNSVRPMHLFGHNVDHDYYFAPLHRGVRSNNHDRRYDRRDAWVELSFRPETDYERALVGMAEPSTRAKWRALRSARTSTLKKCLTPPTLSETRQLPSFLSSCKFVQSPGPRGDEGAQGWQKEASWSL